MRLWCCGSPSFNTSIQDIVSDAVLIVDEASEPLEGDTLVIDLDWTGISDLEGKASTWCEHGCRVIVACCSTSLPRAIEVVRKGADHVLLKPVTTQQLAELLTDEVRAPLGGKQEIATWRERYAPETIGMSPRLVEALEIAMQAAGCDCPVLITGESGTGKELLARALHLASPRVKGPFVPVNCPAIPNELVESELFGHAKGAFTGATMARMGRFSAANNGTLFLDEIGEMNPSIQSKLLRALQDFEITRVGESKSQRVNVRVIAATNRDLEGMCETGAFREDLYYRLNVIQIHLPPLRERREDISLLVDHFLEQLGEQRGMPSPQLTPAAREALLAYHWPGNIRQLANIIERLVILKRGQQVDLKDLPLCVNRPSQTSTTNEIPFLDQLQLPPGGFDLRDALQRFEDTMIRQALTATGGNKNQAAKALGLNRTTLVEKLRKRATA